ncbi:MAG: hypothetical protein LUD44_03475 [Firmicutes bacterium]|nr:hypothetical protein [Bacillota bacterium]
MTGAFFRLLNDVAYYLYPERCIVCGGETDREAPKGSLPRIFCEECRLEFIEYCRHKCPGCGKTIYECKCSTKLLRSHGIDSVYKCFHYDKNARGSAASRLIFSLKSTENGASIDAAAKLLSDRIAREAMIEGYNARDFVITFAPRGGRSIRNYGADHMRLAAERTADNLGADFAPMFRNTSRGAQKEKSAVEREASASGNIRICTRRAKYARGVKFIILDDVLTTGATCLSCAEKLRAVGADEIKIFTLASAFGERANNVGK